MHKAVIKPRGGKYCKMRVANDFNLGLWPKLTNLASEVGN